jgi:prepilin-type processing-associated H-X9-DG protein
MSIKVELDALADEVAARPFGYLLTAGDDGPPHSGAATFTWADGRLVTGAGKTTRRHVGERSTVSLLWPPAEPGGYSLIVDGDATIVGADDPASATVHITPTWAVLHRPAY